MTASKTPAPSLGRPSSPTPGGPHPSPQPSGPKPPPGPPPRSDIYAVAEAVGFGDLKTPVRPDPLEGGSWKAGGPVEPNSEGGRAGDPQVPGAVSGFTLPAMPPVPPWVASRRRLAEVGVGPLYDAGAVFLFLLPPCSCFCCRGGFTPLLDGAR